MKDGLPYPSVGGVPNNVTNSVTDFISSKQNMDLHGMAMAEMQTQRELQHACDLQVSKSTYPVLWEQVNRASLESELDLARATAAGEATLMAMHSAATMPQLATNLGMVPSVVPAVPIPAVPIPVSPKDGFLNFVQFQSTQPNMK